MNQPLPDHQLPSGSRLQLSRYLRVVLLAALLLSILAPGGSITLAASAPTLISPANDSTITVTGEGGSLKTPPVAIPEFKWSAISGATSYRIQLSQESGFTIKYEYTTPLNRFTPTELSRLSDGQWYWHVRVDKPTDKVSAYSETFSFTRSWASAGNYPVLVAPASGAALDFFDAPAFNWKPVMGAASYRFEIATSEEFTTVVDKYYPVATSYQPVKKLANGNYFWRVTPMDAAGRLGTPSESRPFTMHYATAPGLISPDAGVGGTPKWVTFTPTFRWTAVEGANSYTLQYSTDPSFNTTLTTVNTPNTTYTPTATMPNDFNYYWRVRAVSGSSISDWSESRRFKKQWYLQPTLLTPATPAPFVRFPLFSWTPVPGASYYKVELSGTSSFSNIISSLQTSNPFFTPDKYSGAPGTRYWRVTPYDGSGKKGQVSNVSSYVSSQTFNSPSLVYPLYYYIPDNYAPVDGPVTTNPHDDRTVAYPIFIWNKLTDVATGVQLAARYRLEVSTTINFSNIVWSVTTENTYAAPKTTAEFNPLPGQDYFWRVRALDAGSAPVGQISQTWKAHFDYSLAALPISNVAPSLLRPAEGSETVEATPLFEWLPVDNAAGYDIQISRDENFGTLAVNTSVEYPFYAHPESLAQRDRNELDFGTFYWRVRQTGGQWSPAGRFQISAQSQWQTARTLGDAAKALPIADDPSGDVANADLDLTYLYGAQSKDHWFFGFDERGTGSSRYVLLLDLDHLSDSGAPVDPLGGTVSMLAAHMPEYAIVLEKQTDTFSAATAWIYKWEYGVWGVPIDLATLSTFGAGITQTLEGYVEIAVPNTFIGGEQETGSYSVAMFTLPAAGGTPGDSIPSDTAFASSKIVKMFSGISERLNLLMPPTNIQGDAATYAHVLPFFYEYPVGSPWAGAWMKVYLDEKYTTQVAEFKVVSNLPYYADTSHPWPDDLDGDNSYYWRIQPCYNANCAVYGAWSEGWRFERRGFTPQNLTESVSSATPTFSWDMVEGTDKYDLQVDNDPNFGSPDLSTTTTQNSFTPSNTLPNGLYYWRVRVRQFGGVVNEWSMVKTFQLTLPTPQNLTPNDPAENSVFGAAPTFCWSPLIVYSQSDPTQPVMAAYKYSLQISKGDPTFSKPYESVDTEQRCYTPVKGYDDGKYYWRVAMIDGQGKLGDFSPAAVFTKQYPAPVLVSPVDTTVTSTPDFVWKPVLGAASYRFQISTTATFTTIIDQGTTANSWFTPLKIYTPGKTYYWHVAMIDKNGRVGPYNDAQIILGTNPITGGDLLYLPLLRKR